MTASMLKIVRPFHVELHYYVLSHLDLGQDAASIYKQHQENPVWVKPLLKAYKKAKGRLAIQVLPLWTEDILALLSMLKEHTVSYLKDPSGCILSDLLVTSLEQEKDKIQTIWEKDSCSAKARLQQAFSFFEKHLMPLREKIWQELGQIELPLEIVDCTSLGNKQWTHGRATEIQKKRKIAVSLSVPLERVFCQIFHEEVHCITDPIVRTEFPDLEQDTYCESIGFALHKKLEEIAVKRGQEFLQKFAPEMLEHYTAWRRRYGV